MGNKLSHVLIDNGFFSALGTTESHGGGNSLVKRGNPNTQDNNNGVLVVYDEVGRPWIIPTSNFTDEVALNFRFESLVRGAHVPHSNDGGYFVKRILPMLLGK